LAFSDSPEFDESLATKGLDSISFDQDTAILSVQQWAAANQRNNALTPA